MLLQQVSTGERQRIVPTLQWLTWSKRLLGVSQCFLNQNNQKNNFLECPSFLQCLDEWGPATALRGVLWNEYWESMNNKFLLKVFSLLKKILHVRLQTKFSSVL